MTRDKIIQTVLSRLGNREKDKRLQDICVTELQNVQVDRLEQSDFKPWFILSELEYTMTTVGDARVALPSTFLEEYEDGSLLYRPDSTQPWTPLGKDDLDVTRLWARLTGVVPGVSQSYSLVGNDFILETPPTVSYQLAMRYYKRQPLIPEAYQQPQALMENLWMKYAPEWLMCEMGALVAAYHVRDTDAAGSFKTDAMAAKARLYTQHVARAEANQERVMRA